MHSHLKKKRGTLSAIVLFWDYPTDPDTIYVRFDDDILWIEEGAIATLTAFKVNHPQHPVVFANIVNNNVVAHIHQQLGAFQSDTPVGNKCMGTLWASKSMPLSIHQQFMEAIENGTTDKWKFGSRVLDRYLRVSINCICWRGGDLTVPQSIKKSDEEEHVARTYPRRERRPAIICGDALVVHGAFRPQRTPELESLLQQYDRFC